MPENDDNDLTIGDGKVQLDYEGNVQQTHENGDDDLTIGNGKVQFDYEGNVQQTPENDDDSRRHEQEDKNAGILAIVEGKVQLDNMGKVQQMSENDDEDMIPYGRVQEYFQVGKVQF